MPSKLLQSLIARVVPFTAHVQFSDRRSVHQDRADGLAYAHMFERDQNRRMFIEDEERHCLGIWLSNAHSVYGERDSREPINGDE